MIVCDTGPLVAAADRDDAHHDTVVAALEGLREPLVVPAPVVVEVCWLLERNLGATAEAAFLSAGAQGELAIEDLAPADYERMASLVETYADLPLGMVDAAVVAIAERLGITKLLTINRRDFAVVRPSHVDAFELLPA